MTHIAFLGPKGSYSHIAAMIYANYYFDQIIECSCQNFNDIIHLVEQRQAEYGILPIENSYSGLINEVCDLLLKTHLILVADITIPIKHRILVKYNNTSLKQIQIIYSHPQPVQQCSKFLKKFSKWKIIFCKSSAIAIRTVAMLKQSNIAALGSSQGGIFYGLQPLLPKVISNCHTNTTRFIVLKKTNFVMLNTSKFEKIMLIISIDYNLNKLYLILKTLQFYSIKISFLRLLKLFNYNKNVIILEIITHFNNSCTQQALSKIQKISYSLKILGRYSSFINNTSLFIN